MQILNFNNPHLYICMLICVMNAILMAFVSRKLLQILQLSGYKISGYNAWLKDTKIKFISRLFLLGFLSLICILVANSLLNGFGDYYCYLGLIFYIYFNIVFIVHMTKIHQKTPLKQTRRMSRLMITEFILVALITFFLLVFSYRFLPLLKYGVVVFLPPMLILIVPFAHFLMLPIESLFRLKFIRKAKAKLSKRDDLIKIGITGSYGKTSTKHILNVLLSKKYEVCMTPHSFNTPMGLTKVVLKYLKKQHQVLITEMGARNVGDIKFLANFIKPKYGIITSVGSQHLATFGTEENIAKTKYELAEAIDENGFVVFNGQSQGALNLYNKCDKNKLLSGINNQDAYCNITNIKTDSKGSSFDLIIDNQKISCNTKLLGIHNLENIASATVIAYKLGVDLNLIKEAIYSLKPMAHRTEIIENNGITILDNSYNTSVESSKASLEVLKLFENSKKIIVTPGIIEMGTKEFDVNVELGKNIAKVCDYVVIVNKVNHDALKQGLLEMGYNEKSIFEAETLKKASEIIPLIAQRGDVVLFENDLPDNYT